MTADHERLAATTAVSETPATGTDAYQIRGVAIGEGDITRGQSVKRIRWPADVIDGYAALEQESTEVWRCEIGQ